MFRNKCPANERDVKAAEDSRTPRRLRDGLYATTSARFWSAAVLCRFCCFRPHALLCCFASRHYQPI